MGFNSNQFTKQKFEHKTEKLKVEVLADWFGKDEEPIWEVRSLTGSEFVKAQEAQAKNKNLAVLAEALVAGSDKDKVKALKQMVGTTDDVPGELAKRMEMLVFGTVNPEIDMTVAIKLAEYFPSDFMILTNKIINLTSLGSDMVKRKAYGKTSPSETA